MTLYLFVALARRGALSQLLTEAALGSVGYEDLAFLTDLSFHHAGRTIPAHFLRILILTFEMESHMTFHLLVSIS